MSKKLIFYIIFFAIIVGGFFLALSFVIPGFGKQKFPPISIVQPFSFRNQDGTVVSNDDIKGKVTVVNYFFTTCKGVCPRMNNNLRAVYETYKNEPAFLILSHTCDPDRDSVALLKHYSDSMNVNSEKWMFLTGRKDSLYRAARFSYKIDDSRNYVQSLKDDFLHTQFISLVNKKGQVVHIYDGIKQSEMKFMIAEIKNLLKE